MDQEKQVRYVDEDEIDLFDLLKTLWRWRWFVIGLTAAVGVAALAYVLLKPDPPVSYTAKADVQIGKIANINIESVGDLSAYLQSDAFVSGNEELEELRYEFNNFESLQFPDSKDSNFIVSGEEGFRYTIVVTLLYTGRDAEQAQDIVQTAADKIIDRHSRLYNSAIEEYRAARPELKEYLEDSPKYLPLLWLDSYTYPTRINRSATVARDVREDNSKILVTVATLAGLFLSIMLAFMIEAIRNRIREERAAAE